jgi:hypothetical protein
MQSTHQSHERAPEAEGMHGPEVVTSRAPRELPAVIIANLSIPLYIKKIIQLFEQVGRAGNMSCKVLEFYLADACLSRFCLISSGLSTVTEHY